MASDFAAAGLTFEAVADLVREALASVLVLLRRAERAVGLRAERCSVAEATFGAASAALAVAGSAGASEGASGAGAAIARGAEAACV